MYISPDTTKCMETHPTLCLCPTVTFSWTKFRKFSANKDFAYSSYTLRYLHPYNLSTPSHKKTYNFLLLTPQWFIRTPKVFIRVSKAFPIVNSITFSTPKWTSPPVPVALPVWKYRSLPVVWYPGGVLSPFRLGDIGRPKFIIYASHIPKQLYTPVFSLSIPGQTYPSFYPTLFIHKTQPYSPVEPTFSRNLIQFKLESG